MKTCNYLIVFCSFLFCLSCSKELDQSAIDEMITSNLIKGSDINPELLVGKWDISGFAYTKDGKIISPVKVITKVEELFNHSPRISIYLYDDRPRMDLSFIYHIYNFSMSGNLLHYEDGIQYLINQKLTNDGIAVLHSLGNAYSYVVRNNELMIYFTGDKKKNLLIFKKYMP